MLKIPYRPEVDGLRAFSVIAVILFHFYPEKFESGFIGVDIFFVISGFLITQIIEVNCSNNTFSFFGFWKRRFFRLVPALLTILSVSSVAALCLLIPEEADLFGAQLMASVAYVQNLYLMYEKSYFIPFADARPLLHIWSLGVEEQFYLLWPLLIWAFRKLHLRLDLSIIVLSLLSLSSHLAIDSVTKEFYLPLTRFWQFGFGGLAGLYFLKHSEKTHLKSTSQNSLNLFSLFCIGLGFYLSREEDSLQSLYVLPTIIGISLLLVFPQFEKLKSLLSHQFVTYLGKLSYSLYLWHWPILVFGKAIGISRSWYALLILISFAFSMLSYHFVECPIRYRTKNHKKMFFILMSWSLVLFALGLTMKISKGTFSRSGLYGINADFIDFGEKYHSIDGSCKLISDANPVDEWCMINPATLEKTTVAMLGDSFSRFQSFTVNLLGDKFPERNLIANSFSLGMCPPIKNYGPKHCRDFSENIFDKVKAMSHVKYIVVSLRWDLYADGLFYTYFNHKESEQSFLVGLDQSLSELNKMGKKVLVILSQPIYVSPLYCLNRLGSFSLKETCLYPREELKGQNGIFSSKLDKIFEKHEITVFDPMKTFCNTKNCTIQKGNKFFLLNDGLHMSWYGSEFIVENSSEELLKFFSD